MQVKNANFNMKDTAITKFISSTPYNIQSELLYMKDPPVLYPWYWVSMDSSCVVFGSFTALTGNIDESVEFDGK